MSRQELADACNLALARRYAAVGGRSRWAGMTERTVGALERGEIRWPNEDYRWSLCEVLSADERSLGLYIDRPAAPGGAGQWDTGAIVEHQTNSSHPASIAASFGWSTDTLIELIDLGGMDIDVKRRAALAAATVSAAALILPGEDWWLTLAARGRDRVPRRSRVVGAADVEGVREMTQIFSRLDQRRGGGHARSALVQYLSSDVAALLVSTFISDVVRRRMFSAASELAYLAGWTGFDNEDYVVALHHFRTALKLAAEADDAPMAGHVLRAMAHQAIDLGQAKAGLDLAAASLERGRYHRACPRERALLGVVYAKALGANGHKAKAASALLRAEDDLANASPGDEEPSRVFFFGEASLAHETACTLRDTGDLAGSIRQFRRSVRTRKANSFTRTHAVTLGYLAAVQARNRSLDEACATWSQALDAMDGINSGRTRKVVKDMRAALSPLRKRGWAQATELDRRAAQYLKALD